MRSVAVRLDNDLLALRGREAPPDYDYTHGLRVSLELASAPRLGIFPALPACAGDGEAKCLRTEVGAGQRIYTPRRDAPEPVEGERPYAAWLFAAARTEVAQPGRRRSLAVEVGVTGPPALGEPVQNGAHRLLGSEEQLGWAHQLGFEPGVMARYEDVRVLSRPLHGIGQATLEPGWSVTAGNVRVSAGAGADVRLARGSGRGAFAVLGARGEAVARDLFLDGNTFRRNFTAEKLPFVAEGEAGAGYAFARWSLEYRFTVRGREYRAQPAPHRYGSLALTVRR